MINTSTTIDETTIDYTIAAWDNNENCYYIMQDICNSFGFEQLEKIERYHDILETCASRSFPWLKVSEQSIDNAIDEYISRNKEN